MNTTYAFPIDYEEGETFPYLDSSDQCKYHECSNTFYECWQPDELDDAEFNVIILLNSCPVRVRGMHFDFTEMRKK